MNEADKRLLDTRRVKNFPGKDFDNATHVFFRNEDVVNQNTKILNKLAGDQITLSAEIRGYPPGEEPPLKHGKIADTNFERHLVLKIGAKVVMNYNVNISDGKYQLIILLAFIAPECLKIKGQIICKSIKE